MMTGQTLERGAGILLPVTSLPSPYGIGTFGKAAYEFIDFLRRAGQKYWQVLPLGPTSYGDSPYQSFSAFAGNPYFIDLDLLIEEGLVKKEYVDSFSWGDNESYVSYEVIYQNRFQVLREAFRNSFHREAPDFRIFTEENAYWLKDYSLYMACKEYFGSVNWLEWEEDIRFRRPEAVAKYEALLAEDMEFWTFCQYKFFEQWKKLREYATEKKIQIIGDIPIYAAMDSADVWSHPELFQLEEENLFPKFIAGVPPDAFSETGQLWGNPLYDWDALRRDHFSWWIDRIRQQLTLVDILRIDHFRGFSACWAVPSGETTARNGHWTAVPGNEFFETLVRELGDDLPIIAEDLGTITEEVIALRDRFCLPGMKILQFAFEGDYENYFLPHQFKTANCVCYTGTHDNDTTAGWYRNTNDINKDKVRRYMSTDDGGVSWAFIRTCMASIAKYAVFPMQDVLALGSDARMNIPGRSEGNWGWRCRRSDFHPDTARALYQMTHLFGRLEAQQL